MEEKELHELEEHRLVLRNLRLDDYPAVRDIMDRVYQGMGGAWEREEFLALFNRFPEGQICLEDNGKLVAVACTLIVDYKRYSDRHTYQQITADGHFTTHDPNGDTLYGIDVFVHPDYRDMRLGRRLYDARKELCRTLNLKSIIFGGRLPGYHEYANQISPSEYVDQVIAQEIRDPVLSFQLANDFHVRRVIRDYIPDDDASCGNATILEWTNIFYQEQELPLIGARKRSARLGLVQWQMRPVKDLEELMQQVEFFVDALGGYQADFAFFPEFFNMPLMAQFDQSNTAEAIRELAQYTEAICEHLQQLSVSYNINIIAGSLPVYDEEGLYNVAYLFRRNGTIDAQYKLHITPDERHYWGTQGGDGLQVFDTDVGRIGILICSACEFPELSRLLLDKGMEILFVPFWVDTKNGYLRVRRCAQARAIENECYVAITGSVGNLPKVENADIQYSQAAVFTPADFAFPHDGIAAESTPNTEMTLIVDLDLDKLKELRKEGAVRNFQDRRLDLYRVEWLGSNLTRAHNER